MATANTDRNLLFGILALQMDFISREALVKAMNAWVLEKAKSLGQILVEHKALASERHALLEALVQEHLKQHGNDPEQSLAAVSSVGSVREELKQIADPELHASLTQVSAAPKADSWATRAPSVGTPTSSGLRFRILRPHARGGLGQVSVALDEELHREVALKEIQNRHADDPESRGRFLLEAEITGGLEHPGIVPVYGLGQYADGRPFYAMRFIKGDSLKDAIERFHRADQSGRDPGERTLELRKLLGRFIDVCNAIQYAHDRGVLHRDLKPGNIMLGKYGETLVVDWGLAKPMDRQEAGSHSEERPLHPASVSGSAETVAGTAVGTPQFMSPEQAAGRLDQLGPASDLYSLGATLYCLLTGKPPFTDADVGTILQKVQRGDFPPPREVKPAVLPALQAICLKAMALPPEGRYASPRALADDLEHWLADEPVSAWPEPWTARLKRWGRRHRAAVMASSLVLLLAVAALLVILAVENRRRQEAQEYLANLQRSADAADQLADAELHAGRFASAEAILQQTAERLQEEHQLEPVRFRFVERAQRVLRLVEFYHLADEVERLGFEEKVPAALTAGESALQTLDVLHRPDWWAHLPDVDLLPSQRAHLRNEVYRQLELVANLRAMLGQTRTALDLVDRAERFRPSLTGQLLQRSLHLHMGEPDQARPLPTGEPTSAIDDYMLGLIHWAIAGKQPNPLAQLGDLPGILDFKAPLAKAEEYFRQAVRLEPQHYFGYLLLCDTLMQGKRFQEAELAVNGAIGLRPDYETAYAFRAAAILQQVELTRDRQRKKQLVEQAMADSNHAIQLNPQYANAYFTRGLTHWVNKEFDPALADLGQAIHLNNKDARPNTYQGEIYGNRFMNAQAYTYRGQVHASRQEWGLAIADYTEAIRLQPNAAPAFVFRGLAHYRLKQYDQAIADSTQALKINPNDVRAYNNRGISYYFQKKYGQALADFNEAIRLNSRLANPYNHRGQVYAALKEPEKAVADLQQALRLNPKYADACTNLAWLWATYPDAKVRDGKKAVEYATKAAELTSGKDPVAVRTLAAAYAEAGDFDQAVQRQQQALDMPGWTAAERQEARHRLQLYQEHKAFHQE